MATVNSTSLWRSEGLNSVSLKFSQVLKGSSPWRSELMMPSSGPRKVMTPWKVEVELDFWPHRPSEARQHNRWRRVRLC